MAARYGKTDIIVELVKGGADIHIQNIVCCVFVHLMLCMRTHYLVYIPSHRMETLL